jgi:hypothetical protein
MRFRAHVVAAIIVLTAALALFGTIQTPAIGRADACADVGSGAPLPLDQGPCADVLTQEARWLNAITGGDRATIESILSANYRHITSDGELFDRAQEIADTQVLSFTMTPSEQIVGLAGDVAVVHGVNTLNYGSGVTKKVRFTDVFVLQNGVWMALSAQETSM